MHATKMRRHAVFRETRAASPSRAVYRCPLLISFHLEMELHRRRRLSVSRLLRLLPKSNHPHGDAVTSRPTQQQISELQPPTTHTQNLPGCQPAPRNAPPLVEVRTLLLLRKALAGVKSLSPRGRLLIDAVSSTQCNPALDGRCRDMACRDGARSASFCKRIHGERRH